MIELRSAWPVPETPSFPESSYGEKIDIELASNIPFVIGTFMDKYQGTTVSVDVIRKDNGFEVLVYPLTDDQVSMPRFLYNVFDLTNSAMVFDIGDSLTITAISDGSFWLPNQGELPHVQVDHEHRKRLLESTFVYGD